MQRGLVAVAAAAVLCGLSYLALRGLIASGAALDDIVLMTCGATLALAAIATGFSARALFRSNTLHRDLALLSRSVDSAMRQLSARGDRETATLDELNTLVKQELELFSARTPVRQKSYAAAETPARDNIVALSASRRPRPDGAESAAPAPAPDQTGFDAAIERAFARAAPEISLQPIVSISQGAATGFEVHAHIERDDGTGIDLQRLPAPLPNVSQAGFERWLIAGSLEAAKQRFGASADGLPLHVQISDALLSDSDELSAAVELLAASRPAAELLVLSLPAAVVERNARFVEAIDLLAETGARLAAENWTGTKDSLEKMKRSGVSTVKLTADRLLGRTKLPKSSTSALRMVEIASALDIGVIAVNVGNDEDAVSLIDLGINLMTGTRFSGPRRLKPVAESRVGKVASL